MYIPNICVAVDKKADKRKQVTLAYFKCDDTKTQLATNNSAVPFSPFSGGSLSRANNKTVVLSTAAIKKDLACIGACPTCRSKQYTLKATALKLSKIKNASLHCSLCQTPYKVKAAENLIDAIQEENDRAISDDELPVGNSSDEEANESLILASDEDESEDEGIDETPEDMDDDDDSGEDDSYYADDDDDDDESADGDEDAEDADADEFPEDDSSYDESADDDDDDMGEFDSEDDDAEGDAPEAEEEDDDVPLSDEDEEEDEPVESDEGTEPHEDNAETVEASTKDLVINVLAATGGLEDKPLVLVPINSSYALVLANDVPVIKLEAALAGANASLFANPANLAKAFNEAVVASNGKELDLSKLGGKAIEYTVPVAQEIHNKINSGINSVTASLKTKEDTVEQEYRQCLSIASLMVQRNVDREVTNPLFDAFVAQLTKHGVRGDAVLSAANAVFAEAGEEFIKTVLAKATELKAKPIGARNEIAKMVDKTPYHNVTASVADEVANKLAQGGKVINFNKDFKPEPIKEVTAADTANSQVDRFRSLIRR